VERLMSELGVPHRPYRERVHQVFNDIRRGNGKPPLG